MHSLIRPILRAAWPSPSVDRLLRGAMLEDLGAAAAAWREFEASADFDHLTAGEMRLIGLVSNRLAMLAPDSPMRARLEGIGRANWSRSQLTVGEVGKGLRALETASIDVLLVRAAGQVALGGSMARGRLLTDVDIVVRPGDFERASEHLASVGWHAAGSRAAVHHRKISADLVSTGFKHGTFGNLTLRRTPFPPRLPYISLADDVSIWQRSAAGKLGYASVQVPSATDFVVVALAHGAREAREGGDWLADIATSIDRGVDWDLFEFTLERGGLHAAGAIALRYVHERLGRPIPRPVLARLERSALRRPAALVSTLAKARPRSNRTGSTSWFADAAAQRGRRLLRTLRG